MKLSIAMATYNGAKFLRAQLDSFAAQTCLPDELVVCDDGSSDATIAILHDFAATAPFSVRVVQNEQNLGFARNFEKVLSLCTGDLIFLSDQDDVWFPKKLRTVKDAFMADPSILCTINDMIITDMDLNHSNKTQLGNIRVTGSNDNRYIAGCCVAIKRPLLEFLMPFPVADFAHDRWIGDMSVALGVRRLIDEPLQYYRRHGSNESQWVFSDPAGVTVLSVVSATGFTSPVASWQETLRKIAIQKDRLAAGRPVLDRLGLVGRATRANAYLDAEVARFEGRIHLLSLPRYRRWLSVLGFWMRGGYRRFSGWKSAVKDMIRP